tara:strand:- start:7629 stop:8030 length:402 start_codon:yes stop_codon:yes gene_type:complete
MSDQQPIKQVLFSLTELLEQIDSPVAKGKAIRKLSRELQKRKSTAFHIASTSYATSMGVAHANGQLDGFGPTGGPRVQPEDLAYTSVEIAIKSTESPNTGIGFYRVFKEQWDKYASRYWKERAYSVDFLDYSS